MPDAVLLALLGFTTLLILPTAPWVFLSPSHKGGNWGTESWRNKTDDGKLMMEPGLCTQEFQEFWTQRPHPEPLLSNTPSFTRSSSVNPHTAAGKGWISTPPVRQRGWDSWKLVTSQRRKLNEVHRSEFSPTDIYAGLVSARLCARDLGYRDPRGTKCDCSQGTYMVNLSESNRGVC